MNPFHYKFYVTALRRGAGIPWFRSIIDNDVEQWIAVYPRNRSCLVSGRVFGKQEVFPLPRTWVFCSDKL